MAWPLCFTGRNNDSVLSTSNNKISIKVNYTLPTYEINGAHIRKKSKHKKY